MTADVGSTLGVAVTASSTGGEATATSAATAVVTAPTATSSIKEGDALRGIVRWSATAPAGAKSVEFWCDNKRLLTLTAGPYGYDFDMRRYANGAHIVGVAWTDSAGVRHPAWPPTNVTITN
jgi:hypothetical protein